MWWPLWVSWFWLLYTSMSVTFLGLFLSNLTKVE